MTSIADGRSFPYQLTIPPNAPTPKETTIKNTLFENHFPIVLIQMVLEYLDVSIFQFLQRNELNAHAISLPSGAKPISQVGSNVFFSVNQNHTWSFLIFDLIQCIPHHLKGFYRAGGSTGIILPGNFNTMIAQNGNTLYSVDDSNDTDFALQKWTIDTSQKVLYLDSSKDISLPSGAAIDIDQERSVFSLEFDRNTCTLLVGLDDVLMIVSPNDMKNPKTLPIEGIGRIRYTYPLHTTSKDLNEQTYIVSGEHAIMRVSTNAATPPTTLIKQPKFERPIHNPVARIHQKDSRHVPPYVIVTDNQLMMARNPNATEIWGTRYFIVDTTGENAVTTHDFPIINDPDFRYAVKTRSATSSEVWVYTQLPSVNSQKPNEPDTLELRCSTSLSTTLATLTFSHYFPTFFAHEKTVAIYVKNLQDSTLYCMQLGKKKETGWQDGQDKK